MLEASLLLRGRFVDFAKLKHLRGFTRATLRDYLLAMNRRKLAYKRVRRLEQSPKILKNWSDPLAPRADAIRDWQRDMVMLRRALLELERAFLAERAAAEVWRRAKDDEIAWSAAIRADLTCGDDEEKGAA